MPIVCVAVLRTTAWYFLSIKSTLVQNSIFLFFTVNCYTSYEIAMATWSGPWTNMIYDETDVDPSTVSSGIQWPLDDLGIQTKVSKAMLKRADNYTHVKRILSCVCHEKYQHWSYCWQWAARENILEKKIADHYCANEIFESSRNANSLEHRWSTIHKECEYDSLWHICSCKLNRNPAEPPW